MTDQIEHHNSQEFVFQLVENLNTLLEESRPCNLTLLDNEAHLTPYYRSIECSKKNISFRISADKAVIILKNSKI
jgi:hypothetical protein